MSVSISNPLFDKDEDDEFYDATIDAAALQGADEALNSERDILGQSNRQLEETKAKLTESNTRLAQLTREISLSQKETESLKDKVEANEAEIQQLNEESTNQSTTIAALETAKKAAESGRGEESVKLTRTINEHLETLRQQEQEIQRLKEEKQAELEKNNVAMQKLDAVITTSESELGRITEDRDRLQRILDQLNVLQTLKPKIVQEAVETDDFRSAVQQYQNAALSLDGFRKKTRDVVMPIVERDVFKTQPR
jgi:chromosome segregation ATPase